MTNKNEWFFLFNDGGVLPTFIRFTTNKTNDEIKKNYGGNNNYCSNDDGRLLVSVWYCDEYTSDYNELGHDLVNHGASCGVYDANDKRLNFLNAKTIPTVDLDDVMSQPVVNDTGYYDLTW